MVQPDGRVVTVEVAADGDGLVSRAGTALIAGLADRLGVADEFSAALAGTRQRAGGHDPGRVLADLAVMLADGGDCVADLGALRAISRNCSERSRRARRRGAQCSASTRRCLTACVTRAPESALARGRRALEPERVVLDFDSHLISSHSKKEGAAPTSSAASAFTRCCAISTRPARHWRGCCVRATPARTPPPITSGCSSSRLSSCPPTRWMARSSRAAIRRVPVPRLRGRAARDERPLFAGVRDHPDRSPGDPWAARNGVGSGDQPGR